MLREIEVRLERPAIDDQPPISGPWNELPEVTVEANPSMTLKEIATIAMKNLPMQGGPASERGGPPLRVSFKQYTHSTASAYDLNIPTTAGKIDWNVSWAEVTVAGLERGWERGTIPGEVGKICLVDIPAIGNGFSVGWLDFTQAFQQVGGLLGIYAGAKEVATDLRTASQTALERVDAFLALSDAARKLDAGRSTPAQVARFFEMDGPSAEQAAIDLGTSRDEAVAILEALGLELAEYGNYIRPSSFSSSRIPYALASRMDIAHGLLPQSQFTHLIEAYLHLAAAQSHEGLGGIDPPTGRAEIDFNGHFKCQCPKPNCTNLVKFQDLEGRLKLGFSVTSDHLVLDADLVAAAIDHLSLSR